MLDLVETILNTENCDVTKWFVNYSLSQLINHH